MKRALLTVVVSSFVVLGGCSSPASEVITLIPIKDTFDWRKYHLTKAAPDSTDGRFRLIDVASNGDVTLIDRTSGERIHIKHDQTADETAVSKMLMRVTRFDFRTQTADFEWLTTK
jgi:hypothetical protein